MTAIVFSSIFIAVFATLVISARNKSKKWNALDDFQAYKKKHPDLVTDRGVRCAICKSSSIRNWGLDGANDSRRIHICNSCGSHLYRSKH